MSDPISPMGNETVTGTGEATPEEIAANIVDGWFTAKDEAFPELRRRIALAIQRAHTQAFAQGAEGWLPMKTIPEASVCLYVPETVGVGVMVYVRAGKRVGWMPFPPPPAGQSGGEDG